MTRVLVTRPEGQHSRLVGLLAEAGISAVCVPTVSIVPAGPADVARLAAALDRANWLVITSANGVAALAAALAGGSLPARVRLAAVGPATAASLEGIGLAVHAMPPRYLTAAVADALGDVNGRHVVLARADIATPVLRRALLARGASVEDVTAYRTVVGPAGSREAIRPLLEDDLHGILFTSASTVRGLLELVPAHLRQRVTTVPAVCIGPVTAEAARRCGFPVAAVADEHTADGLARATIHYFHQETP